MDGPVFTATFSSVAATTSGNSDLFQITAPSDSRVEICEFEASLMSTAPGLVALQIIRGSTAGGSGGTSPTPAPAQPWSRAAGSSVMANNTTLASSAGTETIHSASLSPARPSYRYTPSAGPSGQRGDSERLYLSAGQRCVFRAGTPSTATVVSGTLKFREIGNT